MSTKATFIPIRNLDDLNAVILMEEALEDVSGIYCVPIISGFCLSEGVLYCCFSHDGSAPSDFYAVFSPHFSNFRSLDDLGLQDKLENTRHGWMWRGAYYFKTPREVETFLARSKS